MERSGLVSIKFKHRMASNTSDKRIADAYVKGARFDVDLVTADGKIVSAHRFVLAMFSKYLAKQLADAGIDGVIIVPMLNFSYDVMKKVVELLYFREINVTPDLRPNIMNAVNFLKIADIADDMKPVVERVVQQTLPQVISQGASQNSGMNPNRIVLQQQPAKPAMNGQNAAYSPAKRVVRAQSVAVGSMPNNGQRVIHPGRASLNLPTQVTITKTPRQQQQRPLVSNVGHPHVPNQMSNPMIGQVQIKAMPKQNGTVDQNPTQLMMRQSPMKMAIAPKNQLSNTMPPPSVTIVPKMVKANTIVQQQQPQPLQQQSQPIVPPTNANSLGQNVTNVGSSSTIDENDNLSDEDMDIDETLNTNMVNGIEMVERKPKVEIISDEIINPANQNAMNGGDGSGKDENDQNTRDQMHGNTKHTELDEYFEDDENNNEQNDNLRDILSGMFDAKTEA